MRAAFAIIAMFLMVGASGWCCYRIWSKKDPPLPITTWLIFSMVVPAVALAAVLQTGIERWGNAQAVVDAMSVVCVLGFMLGTGHYRIGVSALERRVNILCVVLAILVVVYWSCTSAHHYANLALQGVMVVSYIPLWFELLTAKRNPYRFGFWFTLFILSVISFEPAYEDWSENGETMQLWYAGRATVSTLSVLFLMRRLVRREQRNAL